MARPCMPCGKFQGQPITAMRSCFLLWWVSQDSLRETRPATARAILAELRQRFTQGERIEDELLPCDLA
jgi:uncharacterized protein (DUF3820 family)